MSSLSKDIEAWSPLTDKWEFNNIEKDWSQSNGLSIKNVQKLKEMKALFIEKSTKHKNSAIGGGRGSTAMFHPEDAPAPTATEGSCDAPVMRLPESAAPKRVDKSGGSMGITLRVNGEVVGQGRVPAAMSLHFTSNATFDIGTDLDSPVSLDYYDDAPFAFNGTIGTTNITYLKSQ